MDARVRSVYLDEETTVEDIIGFLKIADDGKDGSFNWFRNRSARIYPKCKYVSKSINKEEFQKNPQNIITICSPDPSGSCQDKAACKSLLCFDAEDLREQIETSRKSDNGKGMLNPVWNDVQDPKLVPKYLNSDAVSALDRMLALHDLNYSLRQSTMTKLDGWLLKNIALPVFSEYFSNLFQKGEAVKKFFSTWTPEFVRKGLQKSKNFIFTILNNSAITTFAVIAVTIVRMTLCLVLFGVDLKQLTQKILERFPSWAKTSHPLIWIVTDVFHRFGDCIFKILEFNFGAIVTCSTGAIKLVLGSLCNVYGIVTGQAQAVASAASEQITKLTGSEDVSNAIRKGWISVLQNTTDAMGLTGPEAGYGGLADEFFKPLSFIFNSNINHICLGMLFSMMRDVSVSSVLKTLSLIPNFGWIFQIVKMLYEYAVSLLPEHISKNMSIAKLIRWAWNIVHLRHNVLQLWNFLLECASILQCFVSILKRKYGFLPKGKLEMKNHQLIFKDEHQLNVTDCCSQEFMLVIDRIGNFMQAQTKFLKTENIGAAARLYNWFKRT